VSLDLGRVVGEGRVRRVDVRVGLRVERCIGDAPALTLDRRDGRVVGIVAARVVGVLV
jgi:hypothetical protein